MKIEPVHITLVCLFCRAELKGSEDASYSPGTLIKCKECGEENDYESVVEVAKEKGVAQIKQDLEDQLKNEFKNIFGKKR